MDAVVLVTVLGEIPDRDAALREIRRVLRPGRPAGRRRAVRRPPLPTFAGLRERCAAAGLSPEERSGSWFAYFARFAA